MGATGKAKRGQKQAEFDVALELLASVIWHLSGSVNVRLLDSPHGLVVVVPNARVGPDGLPVMANASESVPVVPIVANNEHLPVVANTQGKAQ